MNLNRQQILVLNKMSIYNPICKLYANHLAESAVYSKCDFIKKQDSISKGLSYSILKSIYEYLAITDKPRVFLEIPLVDFLKIRQELFKLLNEIKNQDGIEKIDVFVNDKLTEAEDAFKKKMDIFWDLENNLSFLIKLLIKTSSLQKECNVKTLKRFLVLKQCAINYKSLLIDRLDQEAKNVFSKNSLMHTEIDNWKLKSLQSLFSGKKIEDLQLDLYNRCSENLEGNFYFECSEFLSEFALPIDYWWIVDNLLKDRNKLVYLPRAVSGSLLYFLLKELGALSTEELHSSIIDYLALASALDRSKNLSGMVKNIVQESNTDVLVVDDTKEIISKAEGIARVLNGG